MQNKRKTRYHSKFNRQTVIKVGKWAKNVDETKKDIFAGMYKRIIGLLLVLVFVSCSNKHVFYQQSQSYVFFGCGGGVTGEIRGFKITGSGRLTQGGDINTEKAILRSVSKSELKGLEKLLSRDSLYRVTEDQSGNMTCFIDIYKKGQLVKQFKWVDGVGPKNQLVKDLYQYLIKLNP